MERLQAALEKAREKREQVTTGPDSPRAARQSMSQESTDLRQLWAAIPEMEISNRKAIKQRLVSLTGGSPATPFDVLRTKVLQLTEANGWKRIAVTSPAPGSGKTTTSLNLALALARQTDLRVTLMDMDMRRPALAKVTGYRGKEEFSSVLEGKARFESQARRLGENLSISMNFSPNRDPSVLFLRDGTTEVLDQIEQEYQPDLMVFDMPPMMVNDDTSAFLKNVDCALIIAEAGVSTINQIDLCEKEMSEQSNVLGVVLNKCRFSSDGYGYYDYKYGY